jgi:hypothetical protein
MGLLDEAIREHLELKRMRGTDQGEVARIEQEALGSIDRAEDAPERYPPVPDGSPSGIDRDEGDLSAAVASARVVGASSVDQETAELDMRTVLGEEHGDASPAAAGSGDPLEWEIPHEDFPGPEGHSGNRSSDRRAPSGDHEGDHPVDGLEEQAEHIAEASSNALHMPEEGRLRQSPQRGLDFDE